jgi:hypothetical protein
VSQHVLKPVFDAERELGYGMFQVKALQFRAPRLKPDQMG